jgi:uncharacterized damage-inducible protein DinB
MNLQDQVRNYTGYNLWANSQYVDWLKTKSPDALEQQVQSSFSTIKQTLFHVWNTEDAWLARMQKSKRRFDYFHIFNEPLEVLYDGVVDQSTRLLQYVQSLPEAALSEQYKFSIPYIGDFDLPQAELVQHCLNHSTYHRGQIVTMARTLGLTDPPMTDYILYVNSRK